MTRSSASAIHWGIRPRRRGEAGFTLIETMVTLAILVVVTFGLLALFDLNNRVARVQTNVADMQQSLRVGQHELVRQVRMLGRGVLPARLHPAGAFAGRPLPMGIAVAVQKATGTVRMGGLADATVLRGTDILIVRGAFESPVYQLNPLNQNLVLIGDPANPTGGILTVFDRTSTGIPHDLGPLKRAIELAQAGNQAPEPLLLISPQDDAVYAVVELDAASRDDDDRVEIRFKITGGTHTTSYNQISTGGGFSPDLQKVAYLALLEEYRYYIREDYSDDDRHTLTPKLSMARFYPGTDVKWGEPGSTTELMVDIADNVFDLQVALGVDANNDQIVTEGTAPGTRNSDEWLYNDAADNETSPGWNGTAADPRRLYYVRITTVARTDRRDPKYQAPPLTVLEDKSYADYSSYWNFNGYAERQYRRQVLQTVVDLRNIS